MDNVLAQIKCKFRRLSPMVLFSIAVLFFVAVYWVSFAFLHGKYSYFFDRFDDSSMDYFNPLWFADTSDPYSKLTNYPPFCFLIMRAIYMINPIEYQGSNPFDLRGRGITNLTFVMYLTVCSIALLVIVLSFFPKERKRNTLLFGGALILSGPYIFTMERGNLILLAAVFLLLFFRLYRSDKLWKRIVAYVCLSICTAMKIYTFVFGILVLFEKRYWEALLLLEIGILCFFLPFFAFGGVKDIQRMIDNILQLEADQDGRTRGTNYNFSFRNMIYIVEVLFGISLNFAGGGLFLALIAVLVVLPLVFLAKKYYQRLLALNIIIIWAPAFSYVYVFLFLIPVLIFFFKEERTINKNNILFLISYIIIFIPLISFFIGKDDGVPYRLTSTTLLVNAVLVFLVIYSYFISFRRRKLT